MDAAEAFPSVARGCLPQSGLYSIGTAGGVRDVWVLFVELLLENYPNMFDRTGVWRVGRLFVDLNVVLLGPLRNN